MKVSKSKFSVAAAVLGVLAAPLAFSAESAKEPARDLGPLVTVAGDQTISATVAIKLSDAAGAEAMMQRVATPGDSLFGKFLTPEQVESQFGPNAADVQKVMTTLTTAGLTVERTSNTTLAVTGITSTFERVFQTSLHQFSEGATSHSSAYTFRAAMARPVIPAEIASIVHGVIGLNTKHAFNSHLVMAPPKLAGRPVKRLATPATVTGDPPGELTVTDFAALYDVNPLYAKGISGTGRTIGIVTLASFKPSDAFFYWDGLGLKTNTNRLSIVNVDGGPGAPSDAAGSDETTLDVQQSGGIAPAARIIVYQAPNTAQGFIDVFAKAIRDNKADSMSTSFGEPEIFDTESLGGTVSDAFSGNQVSALQALHELFVEAALQGQSLFAAAGDSGAFDTVSGLGQGDGFTTPLSVDYPASDPAMTAAGGTTLPGPQTYLLIDGATLTIDVPEERVWGWDYLKPLCNAQGFMNLFDCGIFSVGGGGGVSVEFTIPVYQFATFGTQLSQPGQTLAAIAPNAPQTLFNFRAFFPGRNVPDVSFNADPETGYLLAYTSSVNGFEILTFRGGTSFVAPQLNAVAALLGQKTGHRLGLFNVQLYNLEGRGFQFGPAAAINTISSGDNWFYKGRNGYAPASGVGTLDVANLAKVTF